MNVSSPMLPSAEAGPVRVEAGELCAEGARDGDVDAIAALLELWAARGLTLPRRTAEIRSHLGSFMLVRREDRVLSCGAVEAVLPGLSEIRSVTVHPEATGCGAGRAIMDGLIDRARGRRAERLLLLTKIPAFFERFGFEAMDEEAVPTPFVQKILLAKGRSMRGRTVMGRAV